MMLNKMTSCNTIEVWSPRWHDRKVLIAKFRVGTHNLIKFTKAPSLEGEYYISGENVRKFPLDTNGKIPCYAVSLEELEPLERE
jgi:hypothetical protein